MPNPKKNLEEHPQDNKEATRDVLDYTLASYVLPRDDADIENSYQSMFVDSNIEITNVIPYSCQFKFIQASFSKPQVKFHIQSSSDNRDLGSGGEDNQE